MKTSLFVLSIIIVLIIAALGINYLAPKPPLAIINGHLFSLYLAKTPNEREVGLAKFNKIKTNQGMLFIFNQSDYYSFWMKNMHFPIDIIFINNNKIVDIFKNAPVIKSGNLPIYQTRKKADEVLEINAGLSDKYHIDINSIVNIRL
jgi:uncharacterized membrane protein (UPF0127 family)